MNLGIVIPKYNSVDRPFYDFPVGLAYIKGALTASEKKFMV